MTRPTKHPKTGIYQFRKAVPKALRTIAGKREIKVSLGTKDPEEARRKYAEAALRAEAELDRFRTLENVRSLSAVSEVDEATIKRVGEAYYAYLLEEDDERRLDGFDGTSFEEAAETWKDMDADTRYIYARGMSDTFFEDEVDEVLSWLEFEIRLDPASPSRPALARELQAAVIRAAKAISARNEGEPIETPPTDHIRPIKATMPLQVSRQDTSSQSLTGLLESWWKEAQATGLSPRTYDSYRATIERLRAFVRHDNANAITPDDIIRYKDHRLDFVHPRTKKKISAKTVKDSDLAGLKAIFGWAVTNRKLSSNPASGITVKVPPRVKTRSSGFTDDEAKSLLAQALANHSDKEDPKRRAAKRWVAWVCAYTGARVGEIVQLRKQDLRKEGEYWVLTITPEAGTVKAGGYRDVPLHADLIRQGFPDFVQESPPGFLFFDVKRNGEWRGPAKNLANKLREVVREAVPDPRLQPFHAWRHRFKTICREVDIPEQIADAIQGHSSHSVSAKYGEVTIKAMANALAKFPRQGP